MKSSSDMLKEKVKARMLVAMEQAFHVLEKEEDSRLVNIRLEELFDETKLLAEMVEYIDYHQVKNANVEI